ncbi:hypothetical protein RYX36_017470 [Vicia faba]
MLVEDSGNEGEVSRLWRKCDEISCDAFYLLVVIQFNGSIGTKSDKDLCADVALCAIADFFGHIDSLCKLGHCL